MEEQRDEDIMIRVLLVDEQTVVRRGFRLRFQLESCKDSFQLTKALKLVH